MTHGEDLENSSIGFEDELGYLQVLCLANFILQHVYFFLALMCLGCLRFTSYAFFLPEICIAEEEFASGL